MLYQRYFIRMNQSNMTHLLGLLIAMCAILGLLQLVLMITSQKDIHTKQFEQLKVNTTEVTTETAILTSILMETTEESTTEASITPTTLQATTPPPIQRVYFDPGTRQKSSISLLERIRNPNMRTTNYLNLTAKKVPDYEDEEEEEVQEITHFRERIQMSGKDFRYKTSRNKTSRTGRARRKVNFGDVPPSAPSNDSVLKNQTLGSQMINGYHIGAGLTLLFCILIYSGTLLEHSSRIMVH